MLAAPAMQNRHAQATTDDGMAPHLSSTREAKRAHLFRRAGHQLARHGATLGLLLGLVVAVVLACSEQAPSETKQAPVQVQHRYADARSYGGHALHVGQKQLPCESCHTLTGANFDRPKPEKCIGCHQKQGNTVHAAASAQAKFGVATTAECTSCHQFVPPEQAAEAPAEAPSPWECQRCHAAETGSPHLDFHNDVECKNCHQPHGDPAIKPAGCKNCHSSIEVTHGTAAATSDCTSCHTSMHHKSQVQTQCAECHSQTEPVVPATAVFEHGHESCVSCHAPHDFKKTDTVPCKSCHQNVSRLGTAPAHGVCTNCHSPHDVRGASNESCNNCHASLANDHPKNPKDCLSCHEAHPHGEMGSLHGLGKACSSCHKEASGEMAFHGGNAACTQCHEPHNFVFASAEFTAPDGGVCEDCHAAQFTGTAAFKGHQSCTGCHQGSLHAAEQPARECAECHATIATSVHTGHAECRNCHDPHTTGVTETCGNCHQQELAQAPPGHQQCQQCHDQHSTTILADASCQNCHETQAHGLHGNLPGGCTNCHRPHGPNGLATPPTCGSCHQTNSLPALHAVKEHQDCTLCHSGHQKKVGTERETCLGCHQAQKEHFPNSNRCSGCHAFGHW
jgi:hypothetical protein